MYPSITYVGLDLFQNLPGIIRANANRTLPFADNCFDTVCAFAAPHELAYAVAALKPGGSFVTDFVEPQQGFGKIDEAFQVASSDSLAVKQAKMMVRAAFANCTMRGTSGYISIWRGNLSMHLC